MTIIIFYLLNPKEEEKELNTTTNVFRIQKEVDIFDYEVIALSGKPKSMSSVSIMILDNINEKRAAAGLKTLIPTDDLIAAATIRAQESEQLWSHTRPNGMQWFTVNPSVCYGECLSKGSSSPNAVVDAWINSPAHRDVIMNSNYKTVGIGYYKNNNICYIALEVGY